MNEVNSEKEKFLKLKFAKYVWPLQYMINICTVVRVVMYYYPAQLNTQLTREVVL